MTSIWPLTRTPDSGTSRIGVIPPYPPTPNTARIVDLSRKSRIQKYRPWLGISLCLCATRLTTGHDIDPVDWGEERGGEEGRGEWCWGWRGGRGRSARLTITVWLMRRQTAFEWKWSVKYRYWQYKFYTKIQRVQRTRQILIQRRLRTHHGCSFSIHDDSTLLLFTVYTLHDVNRSTVGVVNFSTFQSTPQNTVPDVFCPRYKNTDGFSQWDYISNVY